MKEDTNKSTIIHAYYAIMKKCGYTWEEMLNEKLPRTLITLIMMEEEAEEIEKKKKKYKRGI